MCKYKAIFDDEKYYCDRENYNNSEFCIFHYGLNNDLQNFNNNKVLDKSKDFKKSFDLYFNQNDLTEYDFKGWVFPFCNFENKSFKYKSNFSKAFFSSRISFHSAEFIEEVNFSEARFMNFVNFRKAKFESSVNFSLNTFSSGVDFYNAEFLSQSSFSNSKFLNKADFTDAKFCNNVNFRNSTFSNVVFFLNANFSGNVEFDDSTFSGFAEFNEAFFSKVLIFDNVNFLNMVFFQNTNFEGNVTFKNVCFSDKVSFIESKFLKQITFNNCPNINSLQLTNIISNEQIIIRYCKIVKFKVENSIIKNFQYIHNEYIDEKSNENLWDFTTQDLSNFTFIESNLSYADFSSCKIQNALFDNCKFRIANKRNALYPHNDKKEDSNLLDSKLQYTYQRFKRQFTDNHHYQLAQDFHFQEMEIRRKLSKKRLEKIVLYCYKKLSQYGTNYVYPFLWLGAFIVFSPIILLIKTFNFKLFTFDFNLCKTALKSMFYLISPFKTNPEFYNSFFYLNYMSSGSALIFEIFFYIVVLTLITLFIQALSRNFKR